MIVLRITNMTKPGSQEEAAENTQDFWKWLDLPITHRIYLPITGQRNSVIQEIEFEDFAQQEEFWADVGSRPEWAQWYEKLLTLVDTGSTRELLTLVE